MVVSGLVSFRAGALTSSIQSESGGLEVDLAIPGYRMAITASLVRDTGYSTGYTDLYRNYC